MESIDFSEIVGASIFSSEIVTDGYKLYPFVPNPDFLFDLRAFKDFSIKPSSLIPPLDLWGILNKNYYILDYF